MERFLQAADVTRAAKVFRTLHRRDISRWALTGGFAIELQILRRGGRPRLRALGDIDFLVASFDCIPQTLADDFIFRHVHPHDPPAKTLLQAIDSAVAVRVDAFRAYGFEMERLSTIELAGFPIKIVSLPDLVARNARLSWDLADGQQIHPKYVQDFLRLLEVVKTEEIEDVWPEHRKPHFPENFAEAVRELRRIIPLRSDLLVPWDYSTNENEVCLRCQETGALRLAPAQQVFSILGYV